jgi:hypothetical protein
MNKQTFPRKQIERSMHLAAVQGYDPYDSHAAQARKYEQVIRMQVLSKLSRSESDANLQLAGSSR